MPDNLVSFPGTNAAEVAPGVPRHDIVNALIDIAIRAEAGEIDALALVASYTEGGVMTLLSTPQHGYYGLLGGLAELTHEIIRASQATPGPRLTEY